MRSKERHKDRNCRYFDAPNWNLNHKCQARDVICQNCKREGHFAKACRLEQRKRKKIKEMTEATETEESNTDKSKNTITKIRHITDRRYHITMTERIDATQKEFIVDTESPVTLIPADKEIFKDKKILPITGKYQDVNENEVNFTWNIMVEG